MIYFDHAATTPVRKEALKCMLPWLSCNTGMQAHYIVLVSKPELQSIRRELMSLN